MKKLKFVGLVLAFAALPLFASGPGDILAGLSANRLAWSNAVMPAMKWVFGVLMICELVYIGFQITFESGWSFREWGAALIKFSLTRGFWAALLIFATTWIPSIIQSFTQIGVTAAGLSQVLSPSDIWNMGIDLGSTLADNSNMAAWFTDPAASSVLCIAILVIVVAFAVMAASLIITLAESFFVLSVGYFFVAFGGSRWTDSGAKNYLTLAFGVGIKIVTIYCILGSAVTQITQWQTEFDSIDTSSTAPLDVALDVMGSSIILAACAFLIPKIFAAVMTGALSGTHSDAVVPVMTMMSAATMATSMAARAMGASNAVGRLLSGGRAVASTASGASTAATGPVVSPPPVPKSV